MHLRNYARETEYVFLGILGRRISSKISLIKDKNKRKFFSKLDGFYAMGACLPNYLQCLNQISYHASCPTVLRFNPINGRCDFV